MKFNEKVRLLKEKVGDKVLFVQNGNFYIAIGKDAVLLNELFNFKKYFINFKKIYYKFCLTKSRMGARMSACKSYVLYIEFTQGFKLFHLGGPSGPLFLNFPKCWSV